MPGGQQADRLMMQEKKTSQFLVEANECAPTRLSWGSLTWMAGGSAALGAEMTFGIAEIAPGARNPLHLHPNCAEFLFVISGSGEHLLGEEVFPIKPGSLVQIPRGVKHWARCTSTEPIRAVIVFSSPHRETESFDGDEIA
jgi:quercetin dioxygenase-like cupin family protein